MKRFFLSCLLTISIFTAFAQNKQQVINKIWDAAGGKKAFDKSRYFEFTFEVKRNDAVVASRQHLWDRYTGDYRFEQNQGKDKKLVVLFNVQTKKGTAYENGIALTDSLNVKAVNKAYANFINDTYWLMIPFKTEDPGVNTILENSEIINGVNYHVLHLNFDKVGLTPGDQYWLYINDKTGAIEKWKFLLQNQKNTSTFDWSPYTAIGNNLKLSTSKVNKENNSTISFPIAKALKSVEQKRFQKP